MILENEALKLPPRERAQLIERLCRSLDPTEQASMDKVWLEESRERLAAYREGKLKSLDGDATLLDIESGLSS